jgi:putative SOS response-associated peptidase YedK
MCGRFYIPEPDDDAGFKTILEYVKNNNKDSPHLDEMKLGEIFPTDIVPTITNKPQSNVSPASVSPVLMKWGFSRFDGKGQIINARLETACEKPMFKQAYDSRRCLIPAGCYYEWRKDGATKQKYAIGLSKPLYMAGLYQYEDDLFLPRFVILTRPAAPGLSFIHDRMPVIIPDECRKKWLVNSLSTQELLEISAVHLKYQEAI